MGLSDIFGAPKTADELAQEQYRKRDEAISKLEDRLEKDREFIKKTFRELCDKANKYEHDTHQLEELRNLKVVGKKVSTDEVHSRITRELIDLKRVEEAIPLLRA